MPAPCSPPADYRPQSSPGALPELPAFLLFLCLRHADHCRDEPRARSLLDAAINAIKRVMKVLGLAAGGGRICAEEQELCWPTWGGRHWGCSLVPRALCDGAGESNLSIPWGWGGLGESVGWECLLLALLEPR